MEKEEKTIPVLTVTKNDALLKNIFLLATTATSSPAPDDALTLLVGRHPDCDVTLSHPSISRFHLRLLSNPSARSLSVIDLSSVHGTWVMGKKIEPNLQVELHEGDTMQIGGSSRVYRLHWVSLSQVYDIGNPFLLPSNACEEEDKDQEILEDENGLLHENNHVQSLDDDNSEGLDCNSSDKKSKLFLKDETPSASPFSVEDAEKKSISDKEHERGIISNSFSEELATESGTETSSCFDYILSEMEIQQFAEEDKFSQKLLDTESEKDLDFLESLPSLHPDEYSVNTGSANFNLFSEFEIQQSDKKVGSWKENMGIPPTNNRSSIADQEKKIGPGFFSEKPLNESEISSSSDEILLKTQNQQCKEENASTKVLVPKLEQNADPLECLASLFSHELSEHSCESRLEILPEIESQHGNKENEIQEDTGTPLVKIDQQLRSSNIWSRCKPSSVLTIQTDRNRGMSKRADLNFEIALSDPVDFENNEVTKSPFIGPVAAEETFTPNKENCTLNTLALNLASYNSSSFERKEEISKNLFIGLNEKNEQFTPDKENITPNTLLTRSRVRMSTMKDVEGSNLYVSSSVERILFSTVEESPTPKLLQKQKLTRSLSRNRKIRKLKSGTKSSTERVPFQNLFQYSSSTSKSEASALSSVTKSCNTFKQAVAIEMKENAREDKRKWHMVVDTNCLLNKESRQALQLLQGLKGTQMIIPRIVIRELDSMNRKGSLFRRTEASCALEWIEECMVNTDWWIHVESSAEEAKPIAPTSPDVPTSRLSEVFHRFSGGVASSVFTAWQSLFEIVSPTAEAHVLDCALLFRGNRNDGKFVLLSNDITLKIKAMAEGLLCETAHEFRESLVNPFSERFLWSDSSPRGLTWSCRDDIILKEKFYEHSMKLGGGAKGLKLILLHVVCHAQTT